MNKTQLLEIARLGIRYKLLDIERTLAAMFHDFPEEFAAKTPPVFVRPVEKPGGNSWPTFAATTGHENGRQGTAPPPARGTLLSRIIAHLQTQPQHQARIYEIAHAVNCYPSSIRGLLKANASTLHNTGGVITLRAKPHSIGEALHRAQATATASTRKPMTAATKQKLARAMKRRHASGEIARARAKAKAATT